MAKRRRRNGGHLRKGDIRNGAKVTLSLLPSLVDRPPAHQIATGKLIAATWADPDDLNAQHRHGRTVKGHRRFDPLLDMVQRDDSEVTVEHLSAAHQLRMKWEHATIGFAARRDLLIHVDVSIGPRDGLTFAALASNAAGREVVRCLRMFTDRRALSLLLHVVVGCRTIESWREAHHCHHYTAVRFLVGSVLDPLAEFFADDIARHGLAA